MGRFATHLGTGLTRRGALGLLGAGCVVGGWGLATGAGMFGIGRGRAGTLRRQGGFALPYGFHGQAVAISPDGRRVAVLGSFGADVLVLDDAGNMLRRFPRKGSTADLSLDFMGDDAVVIPASSTVPSAMLQVVPATGTAPAREIPGPQHGSGGAPDNVAQYYAVSADGTLAACLVDGFKLDHLTMADLRSGRTWTFDLRPALGRADLIEAVALSADARQLAVGTGGSRILFLDPASGRLRSEIAVYPEDLDAGLERIAFSPDGKRVAAGIPLPPNGMTQADRFPGLTLWSVADRRQIRAVETNAQPITQVSWSPDGRYLAALVDRNEGGTQLLLLDTSGRTPDDWRAMPDFLSLRFAAAAPVLALLTLGRVELMRL